MSTLTANAISLTTAAALSVGVLALSATTENKLYNVLRITDGDTVVLKRGDEVVRVRLLCIDAPEIRQTYGQAARVYLQSKLRESKGEVFMESKGKDRFGRTLGYLQSPTGEILNLSLVQEGLAFYYPFSNNCDSPNTYKSAEEQARNQKLGFWEQAQPEYPWVWRRQQRAQGI